MFYQMVHMATIMAIDIGIGRRQSAWKKYFQKGYKRDYTKRTGWPNLEGAEARRGKLFERTL
jgi:hypothetical protein